MRYAFAVALQALLLLKAYAEEAPPTPWPSVVAITPRTIAPKFPAIIRVQEPYCEYGVGVCGGACSEDGGKHWTCGAEELPCYTLGHCKCEPAGVCKPSPPPKKKKGANTAIPSFPSG